MSTSVPVILFEDHKPTACNIEQALEEGLWGPLVFQVYTFDNGNDAKKALQKYGCSILVTDKNGPLEKPPEDMDERDVQQEIIGPDLILVALELTQDKRPLLILPMSTNDQGFKQLLQNMDCPTEVVIAPVLQKPRPPAIVSPQHIESHVRAGLRLLKERIGQPRWRIEPAPGC